MKKNNIFEFKLEPIKSDTGNQKETYEVLAAPIHNETDLDLSDYFLQLNALSSQVLLKETFEYLTKFNDCRISINLNEAMIKHTWVYTYFLERITVLSMTNDLTFAVEVNEQCAHFMTECVNHHLVSLFRENKVSIWLDDFGTGNANFALLSHSIFEVIKIDKCVFWQLHAQAKTLLIELINYFRHTLKLEVVIEGVETRNHLDFTYQNGSMAQGYFFR